MGTLTDGLPRGAHNGFVRGTIAPAKRSPANLEGLEALLPEGKKLVSHSFGFLHQERRIRPHPFAVPASEQTTNGLADCLPKQIPQGNVNTADRVRDGTAATHPESVLVQNFAHPLRLERVLTFIERPKHGESAAH